MVYLVNWILMCFVIPCTCVKARHGDTYQLFQLLEKKIWSVRLAESVRASFSERLCLRKQSAELNEKRPALGCVFEHLVTSRWH